MGPGSSCPPTTLLTLPPELRNKIYAEVFDGSILGQWPFLRTCRQILNEASAIAIQRSRLILHATKQGFYARTTGDPRNVNDILDLLGARSRHIRTVELCTLHRWTFVIWCCEGKLGSLLQKFEAIGAQLETFILTADDFWCQSAISNISKQGVERGVVAAASMVERVFFRNSLQSRRQIAVELVCTMRQTCPVVMKQDTRDLALSGVDRALFSMKEGGRMPRVPNVAELENGVRQVCSKWEQEVDGLYLHVEQLQRDEIWEESDLFKLQMRMK